MTFHPGALPNGQANGGADAHFDEVGPCWTCLAITGSLRATALHPATTGDGSHGAMSEFSRRSHRHLTIFEHSVGDREQYPISQFSTDFVDARVTGSGPTYLPPPGGWAFACTRCRPSPADTSPYEIPKWIDCGMGMRVQHLQRLARPKILFQIDCMNIGYARVSTGDQNLDLQERALRDAGADQIFTDRASGTQDSRKGLSDALATAKPGDNLIVWRLDRLGRSLPHLIAVVTDLGERGVGLRSLHDGLDTSSAQGRLVFHLMGALAEFERALISERTQAGVRAAKSRGVRLGRRPTLSGQQIEHARALVAAGESTSAVAQTLKVGRSTLYRALRAVSAAT